MLFSNINHLGSLGLRSFAPVNLLAKQGVRWFSKDAKNPFHVTPGMVKSFEISSLCMERFPCLHATKISLKEGKEKNAGLGGDEIYVLAKALPKEKVKGFDGHFNKYQNFKGIDKYSYSRPIPEEILSRIFKK
jgi:hypothetical protein